MPPSKLIVPIVFVPQCFVFCLLGGVNYDGCRTNQTSFFCWMRGVIVPPSKLIVTSNMGHNQRTTNYLWCCYQSVFFELEMHRDCSSILGYVWPFMWHALNGSSFKTNTRNMSPYDSHVDECAPSYMYSHCKCQQFCEILAIGMFGICTGCFSG